jgi:hypothetical protein
MDSRHKRLVLSLARNVCTPGVHFNRPVRLFSYLTSLTYKRPYIEAIYQSSITHDISKVIITTIKTLQLLKSNIYSNLKRQGSTFTNLTLQILNHLVRLVARVNCQPIVGSLPTQENTTQINDENSQTGIRPVNPSDKSDPRPHAPQLA